ncbi:MAG: TonB-dependent receptor [Nitrosomonadales bacterium]|nr:TonB-dependent receptor [Nitrosomonadales bacterium]
MRTRLCRGTASLALGLICNLANAAEVTESIGATGLDEVVVTATRVKATLADAPAAVTAVTARDIETKNVSRLGDVLDQVPSLYLRDGALGSSQGTSGTSGMSLRGIDQNKTLILLDGQPLQDGRSGKVNWRIPFVEDIERVEVVPGAFSSLYGSNAIGGVISVITKQPDKHELTARVKKGWQDASGEDGSIYWRERLDNGFGVVVGYGRQNRDSYVNDFVVRSAVAGTPGTPVSGAQPITTRDGAPAWLVGDKGTTPWDSTNATAKLFYFLNERDKLYTGITHQNIDQGYTHFNTYLRDASGVPVSSGPLDINGQLVTLSEINFVNNSPLHEAATRYFAGYDGTAGEHHLLKIDLARIERAYSFTQAGATSTWSGGAGTLMDTPNGAVDATAQLSFPVGLRHFLVTGVALHRDYANQRAYALSDWRNPDSRTSVNSGYNGDSMTRAVFVQDEIQMGDALRVYLGGRVDRWETRGDNFKNTAPAGTTVFASRGASAFSPKLSAVYQANAATTLRASFGRSFRAPTNEDMYTTSTINGLTTQGDPNLQPERGTTWELGGELRAAADTRMTVTWFENRLSNLIYLKQVVPLVLSQRINAGSAKVRGIELSATTGLTDWLALEANYSYIESRMLENSADPLSVGKRLTDSPKNIGGLGMTAQQGAWSGRLGARYVSHIFATARNTDVVEGVPTSYDSCTMVDARVGYAFSGEVRGNLAINNLFDRKAYSYFLMPGRSLLAELVFEF